MKNIFNISIAILATFSVVACSTAPTDEVIGGGTTVTASFSDTRTVLSEGVKTLWSADDKIEVNGVTFTLKAGAGEATATFVSEQPLAAAGSYTATYPAGVATIAAEQTAVAGSFDPAAALASATSTALDNLLFEHKHALLKFTLPSEASQVEVLGYTLKGALVAGTTYYIAIAADNYAGVTAKVDSEVVMSSENPLNAENGKIYNLGLLEKEAAVGIYTAEDLLAFAAAVNAQAAAEQTPDGGEWKDENGVVNIYADIDMKGKEWPMITNFAGTLEGNNKTIDNLVLETTDSSAAMFKNLSNGTVQNLTFGTGCKFSATGVDSNNNTYVATVVARILTGATIKNVKSYATVEGGSQMGGIAGAADLKKGDVLFEDCTNYGSVTVPAKATTANTDVGGICGHNETGVTYRRCTNEGAISDLSTSGNHYNRIGGIVGLGSDQVMEYCYNKAEVKMDERGANRIWIGGLVGEAYRGSANECGNSGAVTVTDKSESAGAAYIGGCFGSVEGNVTLSDGSLYSYKNCSNSASIKISAKPTSDTCLGGVIGLLYLVDVKIEGCTNSGALELTTAKANSCLGGILALAGNKDESKPVNGAILYNCKNTGAVTFSETGNTDWVHVGGVCGKTNHGKFLIEECANEGDVTVASQSRANPGGIVSECKCDIKNCTNRGTIYATSVHADYYSGVGGIASRPQAAITISGCKNYGTIIYNGKGFNKANTNKGIVGQGGIAGLLPYGTIDNCENYGVILGNDYDASLGKAEYKNAKGSIAGWGGEKAAVTIKNCKVGGSIGVCVDTDADMGASKATALTADNYAGLIYGDNANKGVTVSDCSFADKK